MTVAVDASAGGGGRFPRPDCYWCTTRCYCVGSATVAANTPKGVLVPPDRTGRICLPRTPTPTRRRGVSDALCFYAVSLTVDAVLDPVRSGRSRQVGHHIAARELRSGAGSGLYEAGAGRYRQLLNTAAGCRSWRTTGRRRRGAASVPSNGWPRTGSRSSHPHERAPKVLAAMRAAHHLRGAGIRHLRAGLPPVGSGLGQLAGCQNPNRCAPLLPNLEAALPATATVSRQGSRPAGVAGRGLRRRRGLVALPPWRRGRASVRYSRSATSSSRQALPSFASG